MGNRHKYKKGEKRGKKINQVREEKKDTKEIRGVIEIKDGGG